MASVLKEDPYQRRRADDPVVAGSRSQRGAMTVALMLVSVGLLALSRLDHSLVRAARGQLAEAVAPVLSAAIVPFRPVQGAVRSVANMYEAQVEVERLREENQRLKSWESRAKELERRMVQLEQLSKVIPEQPFGYATARVVADSGGPFVRAALLDGGRDMGFKNGYPVINVDGLVGRLSSSGARSSRLLLLTDLNSRVPVYIGASSVRALMLGDNSTFPKLAHIPADARVEPGDDVVTSGVGGVFPRGLKIGTVVDAGDQLRVELHAKLERLEYVSVLFFDSPGNAFVNDEPLTPRAPRRRPGPAGETAGGTQ
jgi:rod shape-determining protein MreC